MAQTLGPQENPREVTGRVELIVAAHLDPKRRWGKRKKTSRKAEEERKKKERNLEKENNRQKEYAGRPLAVSNTPEYSFDSFTMR